MIIILQVKQFWLYRLGECTTLINSIVVVHLVGRTFRSEACPLIILQCRRLKIKIDVILCEYKFGDRITSHLSRWCFGLMLGCSACRRHSHTAHKQRREGARATGALFIIHFSLDITKYFLSICFLLLLPLLLLFAFDCLECQTSTIYSNMLSICSFVNLLMLAVVVYVCVCARSVLCTDSAQRTEMKCRYTAVLSFCSPSRAHTTIGTECIRAFGKHHLLKCHCLGEQKDAIGQHSMAFIVDKRTRTARASHTRPCYVHRSQHDSWLYIATCMRRFPSAYPPCHAPLIQSSNPNSAEFTAIKR